MNWQNWYAALNKPSWTPSGATIGTIWTILYPIIAVSFVYVFYQVYKKRLPKKILPPFIINLAANLAFSLIFFNLKSVPLATIDVIIVWLTIPWIMKTIWKHYRWVALAQIPYLVWVTVATTLQVSIFLSN